MSVKNCCRISTKFIYDIKNGKSTQLIEVINMQGDWMDFIWANYPKLKTNSANLRYIIKTKLLYALKFSTRLFG